MYTKQYVPPFWDIRKYILSPQCMCNIPYITYSRHWRIPKIQSTMILINITVDLRFSLIQLSLSLYTPKLAYTIAADAINSTTRQIYPTVDLACLNSLYDIIGAKNPPSKLDARRNGPIFPLVKKAYTIMNLLACDHEFDLNMRCIDMLLFNELESGILYYC